ncbi:exonuclease domain-containing protein [Fredinandcohnia humi]
MAFEPFIHFVRGLQGKLNIGGLGGVQGHSFQQVAFLRQIQRDLQQEDTLSIPLEALKVVVFDIETTGFFPDQGDEIISLGAVKVQGDKILENDVFYSLVQYEKGLSSEVEELTGLSPGILKTAPPLAEVLIQFFEFSKGYPLVAHHANHEKSFMQHASWKLFRTPFKHRIVDTSFLYRIVDPNLAFTKLEEFCDYYQIPLINRHHALGDALLTANLWTLYSKKIQQLGCHSLRDIYDHLARF